MNARQDVVAATRTNGLMGEALMSYVHKVALALLWNTLNHLRSLAGERIQLIIIKYGQYYSYAIREQEREVFVVKQNCE